MQPTLSMLHPLSSTTQPPAQLNNPFCYTPDALCRQAIDELAGYLSGTAGSAFCAQEVAPDFRAEIARGKMFGVLVVTNGRAGASSNLYYLAGYSGQIGGRSEHPGFVPAVFDYLQPNGYFKREEAEIVKINEEIGRLPHPRVWDGSAFAATKPAATKGKLDGESQEDYVRRRQFENAELHRWKLKERAERIAFEAVEQRKADHMARLKTLRRRKSDALQTWLFRQFVMRNAQGSRKDLISIFEDHAEGTEATPSHRAVTLASTPPRALPPAGAGECCEPKLLQYALSHGLRPVSMAMFWWGESPRNEVRHHLHCYPACNRKCKPILGWMLQGLDVEPHALQQESRHSVETVYEDDDICVIDKPAGMLSVPGKSRRESVMSVMRERYPEASGPLIVHRLDMDTSGLMVVAKNLDAYKDLQRQFAGHCVQKRYVALLSRPLSTHKGEITLPLRPDFDDRPRQVVDRDMGKPCRTRYEVIRERRVALYPHTGRTHQLRLHCAHREGLDNPIVGDALYGTRADRLYLHAEHLVFRHPGTGKPMKFTVRAPF